MNIIQVLSVFSGLTLAMGSAIAATPTKRLIDTGNGKARWVTEAEMQGMSEKAHKDNRCAGFFDLTDVPKSQAKINRTRLPAVDTFTASLATRPLTQGQFLSTALTQLDSGKIVETVTSLSAYTNRYYQSQHGVDAANFISDQFKKLSQNRTDVKVELFKHTFKQPSVIATIAGQGPHANEIVVLGGHEDSINQSSLFGSPEQAAPGADDNATGIATVLEVFRVLIDSGFKPDRTIAFMAYAGEEKGLLGSQDIANKYKSDGKAVVAVVQFDMTGFPGAGDQVVFMTDFTDPNLTKFAQKLLDTYVGVRWSTDKCGYACSDHASWNKAGYPAVMPFEATMDGDNKKIHTKNDLMNLIDFSHSMHFTKLALSFMAELSAN